MTTDPPQIALMIVLLCFFLTLMSSVPGCVPHRIYNDDPAEYLSALPVGDDVDSNADLAIIEFDDHGTFWKTEQMEAAVGAVRQRNAEAERGVLVVVYIHGWQNNADPERNGNLARFREQITQIAAAHRGAGEGRPDKIVGVYLGWRGLSSRIPVHKKMTFWTRRQAAERVASLNMREAIFRIMSATKEREESKCFVVGHSMGGMILGKTLSPSLTTLLLANGVRGTPMPADLVLLQNPALDALASWQFIDFLKRSNATLELRTPDGGVLPAPGPIIVSITSEADKATGRAYTFGRTVSSALTAFRTDRSSERPSQRHLVTHAEGHVDYLFSHRAWVEDGKVVLERVPDAYNNTPFWVVQVSEEISKDHSDISNPLYDQLVDRISQMNRLYDTGVHAWMRIEPLSGP